MKLTNLLAIFAISATASLPASANSPWLSEVYDFLPAPGQFVNELPEFEEGDTKAEILAKVKEALCGDQKPGMISLGAWGGYVVVGFDHPVVNVAGQYDFKIFGNAFEDSAEPGIVMVSVDANKNGIPDDEWYELAGSEQTNPKTLHNYKITYYKTPADHVADPDPNYRYVNDRTYIRWESDNDAKKEGYIMRNTYHSQSYWPEWISDETLTFLGTCLPDNAEDTSGNGSYYVLNAYAYGYVDNQPDADAPGFNIENAVDKNGGKVSLPAIDFIKIYTGLNQTCGWIGESSTEVCGGEDLHPDAVVVDGIDIVEAEQQTAIFTLQGIRMNCAASDLPTGIYIINGKKTAIR